MGEIYGGHLTARHLREVEGVEVVFGLCGGHIDRILDGFFESRIRFVDVRHEQASVMMAHAWSIYTGRPGVCLVTAGPGFTNALTGVVNAYLENAPVVVISGTAPLKDSGKGALQEMDQAGMIKSAVKWSGICRDIRRIPEYIATAFRQAVSGRPGPVFLELPPDVLNVKVDPSQVAPARQGSLTYKSQPEPARTAEAAALINQAERPVIVGGGGVGQSDCGPALRQFIETTGLPFFLLNTGRGTLPDDHPLSLWDGGQMALLTALSQADLVVALGVRFQWLLMFGQGFPQAKVIRVDIDAAEIDRNRPADVGLVGDLGLTLGELNKLVQKRDHTSWRRSLSESYLPLVQAEIDCRQKPADPIHPARLVELIRRAAGDDALYVVDGGDTSYFGLMGLRAAERAGVLGPAGGQFGCLGTGLPFGLAAKLARPDRTVVVINGDGSFGFNVMELHTAVRHGLPVVCVIVNDQSWGMIRHGQEICYGDQRVCGSELGPVHYEKMAQALGGHGELVEKEEQVLPALKRALESGRPACVNVLTDRSACSPATLLLVEGLKME